MDTMEAVRQFQPFMVRPRFSSSCWETNTYIIYTHDDIHDAEDSCNRQEIDVNTVREIHKYSPRECSSMGVMSAVFREQ